MGINDSGEMLAAAKQEVVRLEEENKSLDNFLRLEREAAKQNLDRAERAEAEKWRLLARGAAAEADRLAAKLRVIEDTVKNTDGEWLPGDSFDGLAGEIQGIILGTSPWLPRAILADTDEPKVE